MYCIVFQVAAMWLCNWDDDIMYISDRIMISLVITDEAKKHVFSSWLAVNCDMFFFTRPMLTFFLHTVHAPLGV